MNLLAAGLVDAEMAAWIAWGAGTIGFMLGCFVSWLIEVRPLERKRQAMDDRRRMAEAERDAARKELAQLRAKLKELSK